MFLKKKRQGIAQRIMLLKEKKPNIVEEKSESAATNRRQFEGVSRIEIKQEKNSPRGKKLSVSGRKGKGCEKFRDQQQKIGKRSKGGACRQPFAKGRESA